MRADRVHSPQIDQETWGARWQAVALRQISCRVEADDLVLCRRLGPAQVQPLQTDLARVRASATVQALERELPIVQTPALVLLTDLGSANVPE